MKSTLKKTLIFVLLAVILIVVLSAGIGLFSDRRELELSPLAVISTAQKAGC